MHLGRKPDPAKLQKWTESCWKLTVYVLFTSLAFLVSYREVWFLDSRYFWLGCNHFPPCNLFVTKGQQGPTKARSIYLSASADTSIS